VRFSRAGRRSPRIDISPLVDVVFQLLLFYAVTTQFVADERLKLQLPEAATAERESGQKQAVSEVVVSAAGDVLIDGVAVPDADLERTIAEVVQRSPDKALTIRGDQGADYGKVVRVLDVARQVGAKGVNLAAVKPPEPR
jgi:biopolymer transport protein ExbD